LGAIDTFRMILHHLMFCNTCHHLPLISDTYPPNEPQMFSTGCLHLWSRMAGMKQVLICKEPQPRPPAAAEKIWIKWLDGYLNGSTYGSKNKTMLVLKPMVWGSLILRNLYIIIYIYTMWWPESLAKLVFKQANCCFQSIFWCIL
jgi:hypothetical protein